MSSLHVLKLIFFLLKYASGRVIRKTQKMVLDTALLNTQYCKAQIKGKVEKSKEKSSAIPYSLVL